MEWDIRKKRLYYNQLFYKQCQAEIAKYQAKAKQHLEAEL